MSISGQAPPQKQRSHHISPGLLVTPCLKRQVLVLTYKGKGGGRGGGSLKILKCLDINKKYLLAGVQGYFCIDSGEEQRKQYGPRTVRNTFLGI